MNHSSWHNHAGRHRRNECPIGGPSWRCKGCGRFRPPCDGAADDEPDLCDRCWAREYSRREHRIVGDAPPLNAGARP